METIDQINNDLDSPWFNVCQTLNGRGCISKCAIPKETVVHTSRALSSAISRPYKKEVCSTCFKYEGGKTLKCRLGDNLSLYFCSNECRSIFVSNDIDNVYLDSLLNVEKYYNSGLKKDDEPEITINELELEQQIENEWDGVRRWDDEMNKMKPNKRLNHIPKIGETEYVEIKYIIGILFEMYKNQHYELKFFKDLQSNELDKILKYPMLLQSYMSIYKFIKLTVNSELQPFISIKVIRTILGTNLTNAFGIWSQPACDTEEKDYYGFAIYPSASFFNHSCYPNLIKKREGDTLIFRTLHDIKPGLELFINYGNYANEDVKIRQEQLKEWFFDCNCSKCVDELK